MIKQVAGLGSFNSILFSALTLSLRSNRLKIEEKVMLNKNRFNQGCKLFNVY